MKLAPNKIARISGLIQKYAIEMGCNVMTSVSELSNSHYVIVRYTQCDDAGDLSEVKIRISDHKLPITYEHINGRADFEVGDHQNSHGTWIDAVKYVAERNQLDLPSTIKGLFSSREKKQEQRAVDKLIYDEQREEIRKQYLQALPRIHGYALHRGKQRYSLIDIESDIVLYSVLITDVPLEIKQFPDQLINYLYNQYATEFAHTMSM